MCTYLFLRDVLGPGTLALAANRDESLTRPFTPPELETIAGRAALLPHDHRGGTWLGTNGRLLLALTNAPMDDEDPARRSRGLLVRDLLAKGDVSKARRALREAVNAEPYNGFNLLVADPTSAIVASWASGPLAESELAPGAHLLENHGTGARLLHGPAAGVAQLVASLDPEQSLRLVATTLLASHDTWAAIGREPCRHLEQRGTVAATLVYLDSARPERSLFLFAAGPPCTTPFVHHEVPSPQ